MKARAKRLALILAFCPACLETPRPGTQEAPDAAGGCTSVSFLSDDFESEKPEQWEAFGVADCDLRIDNSRLELDTTESCGLASTGCYDLSDRWVEVDAALPGPGLRFSVYLDDFGDELVMSTAGSKPIELAIVHVAPGSEATTLTSLPYDPDVHQLWRISHSATGNQIHFETSRRSAPSWARLAELWLDGVSVRRVQVRLGASDCEHMVAFDSLAGVAL